MILFARKNLNYNTAERTVECAEKAGRYFIEAQQQQGTRGPVRQPPRLTGDPTPSAGSDRVAIEARFREALSGPTGIFG